jgi:hypothetical protein
MNGPWANDRLTRVRTDAAMQNRSNIEEETSSMNLAEFVDESLTEILAGIRAAQKKEGGDAIGAEFPALAGKGLLVGGGRMGNFTVVDFDVSVVADTKAGGKGGLKVWGVGIEGEAGRSSQQTSRIRFSVQVRIPEGAKAPDSSFDRDDELDHSP